MTYSLLHETWIPVANGAARLRVPVKSTTAPCAGPRSRNVCELDVADRLDRSGSAAANDCRELRIARQQVCLPLDGERGGESGRVTGGNTGNELAARSRLDTAGAIFAGPSRLFPWLHCVETR